MFVTQLNEKLSDSIEIKRLNKRIITIIITIAEIIDSERI